MDKILTAYSPVQTPRTNVLSIHHAQDKFSGKYWNIFNYNEEQLAYFKQHSIFNFNAGVLYFMADSMEIKTLFELALISYNRFPNSTIFEQGHVNNAFKLYGKIDGRLTNHIVQFAYQHKTHWVHNWILHFCGHCGNGTFADKLTFMNQAHSLLNANH